MTIYEYTEAIIPIIRLCLKEKAINSEYRKLHAWYLWRQAFYGFSEFIDWDFCCKISSRALFEYRKIDPNGNLGNCRWSEQPKFDSGRKIFHLEHIYTGDMFRRAIESLPEDQITILKIVDIILQNYRVAWILKEENRLLSRGDRGESLQDAQNIYYDKGIELL